MQHKKSLVKIKLNREAPRSSGERRRLTIRAMVFYRAFHGFGQAKRGYCGI